MIYEDTFTLTEQHITLLRASCVLAGLSGYEHGAAAIDPKRPYGNSDVIRDVARLIGVELVDDEYLRKADRERCSLLHEQTPTALQIVLVTGVFQPGVYRMADRFDVRSWQMVEVIE